MGESIPVAATLLAVLAKAPGVCGSAKMRVSPDVPRSLGTPEQSAVEQFLTSRTEIAFEELCRVLAPKLLHYFELRGCQPTSAEELTQDVMLAVYRGIGTLRESKAVQGWIFGIARNLLLQHWRRFRVRAQEVGLESLDGLQPKSEPVELDQLSPRFRQWMNYLEPEERKVMSLRFLDDLEYHEIAARLSIPIGTVKWRIFNSRVKLLKHFGPKGDGSC
jgi:RNA polymerase sigma-70 factor (ECF subfamily)